MAKKKLEKTGTQPRQLNFPLRPEELAEKQSQVIALLGEIERESDKRAEAALTAKAVDKDFQAKIHGLEKNVRTLRQQIESATEPREVICDVYANAEESVFEIHNPNVPEGKPGRIISRVPMTIMDKAEAEERNAEADAKLTEDEKAALADAETAQEAAAEAEMKPKVKPTKKSQPEAKAKAKKGNGKGHAVSNADMAGVEDMPPLVTMHGGKGGKDIEV